jgi:hypothetical protein
MYARRRLGSTPPVIRTPREYRRLVVSDDGMMMNVHGLPQQSSLVDGSSDDEVDGQLARTKCPAYLVLVNAGSKPIPGHADFRSRLSPLMFGTRPPTALARAVVATPVAWLEFPPVAVPSEQSRPCGQAEVVNHEQSLVQQVPTLVPKKIRRFGGRRCEKEREVARFSRSSGST